MTTPRPKDPIDSFGAEVFNALVEGSKRRIELLMPYNDAVRLRLRIHRLRSQMRKEGHQLYGLVLKAELRIELPPNIPTKVSSRGVHTPVDKTTVVKLVMSPRDSDFADILSKAGVKVPTLTNEQFDDDLASPAPSLDDLMKDIK
jgi:hypothetical protein